MSLKISFFFPAILTFCCSILHNIDSCADIEQQRNIDTSLDHTVNPCDDFYAFACGNYEQQHSNPSYKEITVLMDYKYNRKIYNLLETLYQSQPDVPDQCQNIVEKTRVYYKACRQTNMRNVTKYFEEIKPSAQLNWPILEELMRKSYLKTDDWPGNNAFDVWSLLGKLQSYGVNNLLINQEIVVEQNGALVITLEPAFIENNTTLPPDMILQVLLMALGIESMERNGELLAELQVINEQLLDIVKTFTQSNIVITESYSNLRSLYPQLNLSEYIVQLLGVDVPSDTLVVLRNPEYFQHLNDNMWQTLEEEGLCNYLMMKFLFYLAEDGTQSFSTSDCIKDLRNKLDLAVNYIYYSHIFLPQADLYRNNINMLRENLVNAFDLYFKENNLNLSTSQVEMLREKLYNLQVNIGNLPANVTREKIEKFYKHLPTLDRNNYYKNHLLLLQHRFFKSVHYPQNQTHFIVADNRLGSSSGAFYVIRQNMIILPFGSLQSPLYSNHYQHLYLDSLLGFILGHELTHAFETTGLNFDHLGHTLSTDSGILKNTNFVNAVNCLQSQLPTDAIDERIADIVGIRVAYKAFISNYNNDPTSLRSDWKKIFFLNLAQFFCGKNSVEFVDHDSDAQRLHQIVMNSEAFDEAFKCPENSKMYTENKCRLY